MPDPAKSQSFNRYSYVTNNPIRYTDPTGHYGDDGHEAATRAIVQKVAAELTTNLGDAFVPGHYESIPFLTKLPDYEAATTPFYLAKPWATFKNMAIPRTISDFGEVTEGYATEYYHFQDRATNEGRLRWAIEQQDIFAFGRALHGYQDSFSHIESGFSFSAGRAGIDELLTKCQECFFVSAEQNGQYLNQAFWNLGHIPHSIGEFQSWYTDRYAASNARDQKMALGTEYWITLYLLNQSGVNANDYYMQQYGMTHEEWYQQNVGQE